MPSVCMYFQVHQPWRLRRYSFLNPHPRGVYFDDAKNEEIMQKVASKCYLPANQVLLDLIRRHEGRFRISFSITGVALEQMMRFSPETILSFQRLSQTGCVEFLGETYHHSLASLYDREEFSAQVAAHAQLMRELFEVSPSVFRNTELIYSDQIGALVSTLGYQAVLAEGADDILAWRSPNFIYHVENHPQTRLLLKNYRLSDDIAFRFSNRGWSEWPLTAEKYARWIHQIAGAGESVNLFMDYETFGEHQWESTGIFAFLEHLPGAILANPEWLFLTPTETVARYPASAALSVPRVTSWADIERDTTAWQGNMMQRGALERAYELGRRVKEIADPQLLRTWRSLLTSDHFYYMCTKWFADGDVHAYFSPYESPYEAFVNYMNVLKDFRVRLGLPAFEVPQFTDKQL